MMPSIVSSSKGRKRGEGRGRRSGWVELRRGSAWVDPSANFEDLLGVRGMYVLQRDY